MNRRGFLASCVAGAILGLARHLPMPAVAAPVRNPLQWANLHAILDAMHDLAVFGMATVKLADGQIKHIRWETERDQVYGRSPVEDFLLAVSRVPRRLLP